MSARPQPRHQRYDYYPAVSARTNERAARRAAIFEGIGQRFDEALAEHPEIAHVLDDDSADVYMSLDGLAVSISYYTLGMLEKRAEVRPAFDNCIASYLRAADRLKRGTVAAFKEEMAGLREFMPALDLGLMTPEIATAEWALEERVGDFLRGDCAERDVLDAVYELIARRLEAVEPTEDLTGPAPDAEAERIDALEI